MLLIGINLGKILGGALQNESWGLEDSPPVQSSGKIPGRVSGGWSPPEAEAFL